MRFSLSKKQPSIASGLCHRLIEGLRYLNDLYFQTDQVRNDSEIALFGEINYRLTEDLTATLGYRQFDGETTLDGFVGTVFWPNCCYAFDDNRPPDNVASKAEYDDGILKLNLSYNPERIGDGLRQLRRGIPTRRRQSSHLASATHSIPIT